MGVLAASVVTKSGKALVSRKFVVMPRTIIEGLLAAFPKLVGTEKQHTYVETENVKQYREMESHEEKLQKLVLQSKINETKDVMKRKASEIDKSKSRGEKKGFISLKSMGSGRIDSFFGSDVKMYSSGSGAGFGFSTDVETLSSRYNGGPLSSATAPPKSLGLKLGKSQKSNQFLESLKAEGEVILEDVRPNGGPSKAAVVPLTDPVTLIVEEKLNVRLNTMVESATSIFKEPCLSKSLTRMMGLFKSRYDPRNSILEWSMLLIDNPNRSGSMEFVVPPADSSAFFPVSVCFTAASTFSGLKVLNIIPLKGEAPPKFSQRTQLSTENYQVI